MTAQPTRFVVWVRDRSKPAGWAIVGTVATVSETGALLDRYAGAIVLPAGFPPPLIRKPGPKAKKAC